MEQTWIKALSANPPKKVNVEIKPLYNSDSLRPTEFKVNYTIEGKLKRTVVIQNQAGG